MIPLIFIVQVVDFERDINLVKTGQARPEDLTYKKVVGLDEGLEPVKKPDILARKAKEESTGGTGSEGSPTEGDSDDSGTNEESSDDGDGEKSKFVNSSRGKETLEEKKVRFLRGWTEKLALKL